MDIRNRIGTATRTKHEPFELLLVTQSHEDLLVIIGNMVQDGMVSSLCKHRGHVERSLVNSASSPGCHCELRSNATTVGENRALGDITEMRDILLTLYFRKPRQLKLRAREEIRSHWSPTKR